MRLKNKRSIQILSCAVLLFFLTAQQSNALAPSRNISVPPSLTQYSFSDATLFFWFFPQPVFTALFLSLSVVTYFVEGEKIKKKRELDELQLELSYALAKCKSEREKIVYEAVAKQLEIPLKSEIKQYDAFLELSYKLLKILFLFIFISIPSFSYLLWKNAKEVCTFLLFFSAAIFVDSKLKAKKPTQITQSPFSVVEFGGRLTEFSL